MERRAVAERKVAGKEKQGESTTIEAEEEDEKIPLGNAEDEMIGKSGRRRGLSSGAAAPQWWCQVDKCAADMAEAKRYHRRHKVCEAHSKAPFVLLAGLRQRFCQQCSRFHDVSEFDDTKRSCRRRLAGHNERRRKSSSEVANGEEPGRWSTVRPGGGGSQTNIPANPSYKHFQVT